MRKLFLLPFLLLAFSESALAQLFGADFPAHTIRPPELYVDNVKKVAVLNFKDENNPSYKYWNNEGDNGSKMADYVTSTLLNEKIGLGDAKKLYFTGFRTNIFTVVERSALDNVLKEQKLGASGAIDDSEASQAGKLLGIDMLITGGLSYTHKDDNSRKENKDKDGKITGYTYTVTRTVFATTRVKYVSVATGQILAAKEFTGQESHSVSDSKSLSYSVLNPPEVIADQAFRQIGSKVGLFFTPTFEARTIDILRMKNKDYRDMGKEANDFLKDGKIDRAILVYAKIQEMDPYSQEAAYNQGALQEGTGNYEKALENYKMALEIDPEDKKFKEAVARAEGGIKVVAYLKTKDITIAPYEFAEAGSGSKKLADMITLRGKEKDRYDVFQKMDVTSPIVMKVAGGRELEVLEKTDTWVKVKLLGGKEGYIEAAHVK